VIRSRPSGFKNVETDTSLTFFGQPKIRFNSVACETCDGFFRQVVKAELRMSDDIGQGQGRRLQDVLQQATMLRQTNTTWNTSSMFGPSNITNSTHANTAVEDVDSASFGAEKEESQIVSTLFAVTGSSNQYNLVCIFFRWHT